MPNGTPYLEEARIISRSHKPAGDWAAAGIAIQMLKIDPASMATTRRQPLFPILGYLLSASGIPVALLTGGIALTRCRTLVKGLALRLSSLLWTVEWGAIMGASFSGLDVDHIGTIAGYSEETRQLFRVLSQK